MATLPVGLSFFVSYPVFIIVKILEQMTHSQKKHRLLIPITVQFSVRYIIRTGLIENIFSYAQPIVILGWKDNELKQELIDLGAEVHFLPSKRIGKKYSRLLMQMTQWHLRKINTPTTKIDNYRNNLLTPQSLLLRKTLRNSLYKILTSFPSYNRLLHRQQEKLIWSDTNLAEYYEIVKTVKPDLAFSLTPYFIEEEFLLRAVQSTNVPLLTAILSFDNLTTRGYIPVRFEEYFLWNKYNEAELRRIYDEAKNQPVTIVGAPQFDFYYDSTYIWNEHKWRVELGLPTNRPVVLFGSASELIAPQEDQWLIQLDQAISNNEIKGNPLILVRPHPNERKTRWDVLKKSSINIFFDEPWKPGENSPGKTNIKRKDIEKLTSTLFHSSVHVNASSTMTVDGSIFDRPQIGPAYDDTGKFHKLAYDNYLREHYLPITRSGGLEIVRCRSELIRAINTAFTDPYRLSEQRQKLVKEICTYDDGKSAQRVNRALANFIGSLRNEKL